MRTCPQGPVAAATCPAAAPANPRASTTPTTISTHRHPSPPRPATMSDPALARACDSDGDGGHPRTLAFLHALFPPPPPPAPGPSPEHAILAALGAAVDDDRQLEHVRNALAAWSGAYVRAGRAGVPAASTSAALAPAQLDQLVLQLLHRAHEDKRPSGRSLSPPPSLPALFARSALPTSPTPPPRRPRPVAPARTLSGLSAGALAPTSTTSSPWATPLFPSSALPLTPRSSRPASPILAGTPTIPPGTPVGSGRGSCAFASDADPVVAPITRSTATSPAPGGPVAPAVGVIGSSSPRDSPRLAPRPLSRALYSDGHPLNLSHSSTLSRPASPSPLAPCVPPHVLTSASNSRPASPTVSMANTSPQRFNVAAAEFTPRTSAASAPGTSAGAGAGAPTSTPGALTSGTTVVSPRTTLPSALQVVSGPGPGPGWSVPPPPGSISSSHASSSSAFSFARWPGTSEDSPPQSESLVGPLSSLAVSTPTREKECEDEDEEDEFSPFPAPPPKAPERILPFAASVAPIAAIGSASVPPSASGLPLATEPSRPWRPPGPPTPRVCRFYLAGDCRRADCRFSHDRSRALCKYYLRGDCWNEQCAFLHEPPEEEAERDDFPSLTPGRTVRVAPAPTSGSGSASEERPGTNPGPAPGLGHTAARSAVSYVSAAGTKRSRRSAARAESRRSTTATTAAASRSKDEGLRAAR